MWSEHDFEYAIENTEVLLAPDSRIATFGSTVFEFRVISELMDKIDEVRVREGRLHAERPSVISQETISRLLLEGFGEEARGYADFLQARMGQMPILKYGFVVRKTDVTESIIHDRVEAVTERVLAEARRPGSVSRAVIRGVDEAWEIALLRFTWDMVRKSADGNFGDLKDRGLL